MTSAHLFQKPFFQFLSTPLLSTPFLLTKSMFLSQKSQSHLMTNFLSFKTINPYYWLEKHSSNRTINSNQISLYLV